MKKKALIFIGQPPGSTGAQATRYSKLLEPLLELGWELHFIGPNPKLNSVHTTRIKNQDRICHYVGSVPYSRRFSIYRHRLSSKNLLGRSCYGFGQLVARLIENIINPNNTANLVQNITHRAEEVIREISFDLIAGVSPVFEILTAGFNFSASAKLPFIAIYHDPFGAREDQKFTPNEYELQKKILDGCNCALFMSSLTRERYINVGLIDRPKSASVTDSFNFCSTPHAYDDIADSTGKIIFSHMGNLATWRPVDQLLEAWMEVASQSGIKLILNNYGLMYAKAERVIKKHPVLRSTIHPYKEKQLHESHTVAAKSDVLLVVVGPRHNDNIPSKFFEYLGHNKPMLVLGPSENPLEKIVKELGNGVYCDISDKNSIRDGLLNIILNLHHFIQNYTLNKDKIDYYSSSEVAKRWAKIFDSAIY